MSCIPMVQAGGFNGRFLQSYVLDTTPAIMHQDDTTFFSRESWIKHLLFATGILGLGGEINPRYVRKYAQDLFPHKAGMSCTKSSRTWGCRFFFASDFGPHKNRPVIFGFVAWILWRNLGMCLPKSVKIEVTKFSRSGLFVGLVGLFLLINNDLEFSVCNLEPKQGA